MRYWVVVCLMASLLPGAERLVTVNAVAVDRRGNPVSDLKAGELQVAENGKPQRIVSFRYADTRKSVAAPLGKDEYSNRTEDTGHATVILFDLLNEHLDARGPAWDRLNHVLPALESSRGLYLYLLTMDGRLYPVHGLPNPERPEPAESTPWTRDAKPLLTAAMNKVTMARPVDIFVDDRIRMAYQALETLAGMMAEIPGRKNIVWITHGVPITLSPDETGLADWLDFTPLLRQLSERLERANVSIYPVQQIPPGMAMEGEPEALHSGMGSQYTLLQFARYTGGRADGGNDIGQVIRQAMNDVRAGYQIGYDPSPQNRDGKFHKLRVTCSRKGVRIQVKEGYYAWPEAPFTAERQQDALHSALTAPTDSAEIGLRVTVSRGVGNEVKLAVRVDPSDVLLKQEGGAWVGELKFALVSLNIAAVGKESPAETMALQFTAEQYEQVSQHGIALERRLTAAPETKEIRLAVLDTNGGGLGRVTVPVK